MEILKQLAVVLRLINDNRWLYAYLATLAAVVVLAM